jgi:hypothetical protein
MAPSRIEGIALQWPEMPRDFGLRYAVKIGGQRPTATEPVPAGTYAGTRGRALPLIGAALEISGPSARGYQLVVDAIFLESPQMRVTGQRTVLSGPTGREPLVGLRVGIEAVNQPKPAPRRAAAPDPVPSAPAKPAAKKAPERVRVFRSEATKASGVAPTEAQAAEGESTPAPDRVRVFRKNARPDADQPAG